MQRITTTFRIFVVLILTLIFLGASSLPPADEMERIRRSTRNIEFDYVGWTLDAMLVKMEESSLPMPDFFDQPTQVRFVLETVNLVERMNALSDEIEKIYSDPTIKNPDQAAADLLKQQDRYKAIMKKAGPVTEAIIQGQISTVLKKEGLTLAGQPIPPVLYHVTPLPLALIVSPRDAIRQDANISLNADLSVPEMETLEKQVAANVDKSTLVVEIGGVGIYPTMVMSTSDLPFLVETVAHEWTHNYLTMRPLGLNYETTPELRTMNETTASIVGREVGREVLKEFYPDHVPPEPPAEPEDQTQQQASPTPAPTPTGPPPFDFRAEMHETRVTVDALLAQKKINEAESYMESRRVFMWDHGYQIRKLNQAYFAFYGAYADSPGGAAGQDPVGPAVRALRRQSASLKDFVNRIAWMTSFDALQSAVASGKPG